MPFNLSPVLLSSEAEVIEEGIFLVIFFTIYFGIISLFILYYLACWFFQAFAVYKMSKKLNLTNCWVAFFPYANSYAFGRLAEQHDQNGKKPFKYSVVLLILSMLPGILYMFVYFAMIVIMIMAVYFLPQALAIVVMYAILFTIYGFMAILAITASIIQAFATWHIFSIFAGNNAVVFLVLSLVLGIAPFLLFACCNKEPHNYISKNEADTVA